MCSVSLSHKASPLRLISRLDIPSGTHKSRLGNILQRLFFSPKAPTDAARSPVGNTGDIPNATYGVRGVGTDVG
jgi:hypothetical protein